MLPDYVIVILGVILPLAYQFFITKLPGIWKAVVSYLLSCVIAIIVSIFMLDIHSIKEILTNIVWILSVSNIIYQMLIKQADKAIKNSISTGKGIWYRASMIGKSK